MSIMRSVKRNVVNILAFKDTSRGFTGKEARRWVRKVYRSYFKNPDYTFKQTRWAVKKGFLPEQVEGLNLNESNYKDTISAKDYAFLRPLNGMYSKWIADKVTVNAIFKPFRDRMPKCYYHLMKRDGNTLVIPLYDQNAEDSFTGVLNLLKTEKRLRACMTRGRKNSLLEWKNDRLYWDGAEISEEFFIQKLSAYRSNIIISEDVNPIPEFKGATINLIVMNEQGDNPVIGDSYVCYELVERQKAPLPRVLEEEKGLDELEEDDDEMEDAAKSEAEESESSKESTLEEIEQEESIEGLKIYAYINSITGEVSDAVSVKRGKRIPRSENPNNGMPLAGEIPFWEEIKETVDRFCRFVPELEFFGMKIMICENGFKIIKLVNHPAYPRSVPFSKQTSDYLKYKVRQKKEAYKGLSTKIKRGCKKIKLKVRSTYAKVFFPQGLLPYLAIKWPKDQRRDFFVNKDTSLKEKRWAKKYGFLSYRLHQYGITDENRKDFISDFEYRWLRHINGKYRRWMEDKITVKYICSDYNNCFPEYYFHISLKNGNNKVISMMDCPEGYSNTYEDIFRLVQEKKSLALKPDEGSHGDGFYKLTYYNGKYYLNHEETDKQAILNILEDVNNRYLVTEYINMHPVIKNIYDGAVNTIRMIVFKKDGKNPQIGNAYMRFGSKKTGAVDNMGAGGMFAKIDIDTGRFYDSKIIEGNEIKPCLYHPDTNVKIEGYLPNWEKVKATVLDVARSIPQLEYFGFDLAITEDGIKFPEINRFPDYPAIEKLSPQTMDYLLYKLEMKKMRYGSASFRGTRLVKLPPR